MPLENIQLENMHATGEHTTGEHACNWRTYMQLENMQLENIGCVFRKLYSATGEHGLAREGGVFQENATGEHATGEHVQLGAPDTQLKNMCNWRTWPLENRQLENIQPGEHV
jgi:hypothetical protein